MPHLSVILRAHVRTNINRLSVGTIENFFNTAIAEYIGLIAVDVTTFSFQTPKEFIMIQLNELLEV